MEDVGCMAASSIRERLMEDNATCQGSEEEERTLLKEMKSVNDEVEKNTA